MKKKYLTIIFFTTSFIVSGQTVKRLNDPFIVAQEKRQVFEKWGDFSPHPKYNLLGIQTNVAYARAWGWMAHSRNRRYKNGPDIRPLRTGGEETIRMIKAQTMKRQAELSKVSIDSIYKRSLSDMAHWTSLTATADPLFLLYYKKMLEPLKQFPEEPKTHTQWGLKNDKIFQKMKSTGQIKVLQEELHILKETYKKAMTLDMPRGKRFLMYHKALIGWRKFSKTLSGAERSYLTAMEYEEKKRKKISTEMFTRNQSDRDIIESIMQQFKNKF